MDSNSDKFPHPSHVWKKSWWGEGEEGIVHVMIQANEKYSREMFWEQLLSELSISANLMHSTGKANVQWLLWKKNA